MNRNRLLPLASAFLVSSIALTACSDNHPLGLDESIAAPDASLNRGAAASDAFLPGQIIVRFRTGANETQIAGANGASVKRQMRLARTWLLNVPAGKEQTVVAALSKNPNVEFAEPDYLYTLTPCEVGGCDRPSDPHLGYKWDLHNDGSIKTAAGTVLGTTGKVDADIDWIEAYDHLGSDFGGSAVIAILDSGIRKTHQDLAGKIIAERNFATGYAETLVEDRDGHGTHVAGIAAAHGNNGAGVAGVAYGKNIKLINAKVCERYIVGYEADGTTPIIRTSCPASSTADAIIWATDQGANVLNLSLGGSPLATSGSAAQQAAFQYARSKNVLPFCATGNDNYNGISFPARFPECVAVGATGWSDARASYSNYGAQTELSAPGGDVNSLGTAYSLILAPVFSGDGSYGWKAGTSMATPQVAGLAGLLFATGMTDANAILQRMKVTADDLGSAGWDQEFGSGRINVYRAVTGKDPNAAPVAVIGGPYTGSEGSAVQFSSLGSNDPNGKPITYAWNFGDGNTSTSANPSHAYANNGSYVVTLTVTDPSGLTHTATTTAAIVNVAPQVTVHSVTVSNGQPVVLSAFFADPGSDSWTCTINWGDNNVSTVQNCTPATTVSNTYRSAGTFRVRVTVKETTPEAASGTAQFEVTVKGGGQGSTTNGASTTKP